MINIEHILSLPPGKRDDEIRKLIVPKPWKHDWTWDVMSGANYNFYCSTCGLEDNRNHGGGSVSLVCEKLNKEYLPKKPCPVPDPIPLDWNLAMEMRDEFTNDSSGNFEEALAEVYEAATDQIIRGLDVMFGWWASIAQPHHYLLAALKAKEIKE